MREINIAVKKIALKYLYGIYIYIGKKLILLKKNF